MGFIAPSIWDDETFVLLNKEQKLVWMYLLTGPESLGIPGLLKLTINGVADGLREDAATVRDSVQQLVKYGRIDIDIGKRLIRVPNAPKYNPPQNPNHVRGWYRKWVQLSDSPLKVAHVASLRAVVDRIAQNSGKRDGAGWRSAWSETFGSINSHVRNLSAQESLFAIGSAPKSLPEDKALSKASTIDDFGAEGTGTGSRDPDWNAEEPSQDERERSSSVEGFTEAFGHRRPKTRIPDLSPDQGSEIRDPDQDPRSEAPKADSSANVVHMPTTVTLRERARKAWKLQEELRAALGFRISPEPSSASLDIVVRCLAETSATDETVEYVLRGYAALPPDKAEKYFDGVSNWAPKSFLKQSMLPIGKSEVGTHSGGHFKVTGNEKYGDGKSVVTRKH